MATINKRVIGVDISNEKTSYGIVDIRGNIIARNSFPTWVSLLGTILTSTHLSRNSPPHWLALPRLTVATRPYGRLASAAPVPVKCPAA